MMLNMYKKTNLKKSVFYFKDSFSCSCCTKPINDVMIVVVEWFKPPHPNVLYLHAGCVKKAKKIFFNPLVKQRQFFTARFVGSLPSGCLPVYLDVPSYSNSSNSLNLFAMARKDEVGVKVVDRTRLADRETWDGAKIGADVNDILLLKDAPLKSNDVVVKFLEGCK